MKKKHDEPGGGGVDISEGVAGIRQISSGYPQERFELQDKNVFFSQNFLCDLSLARAGPVVASQ